MVNSDGVTCNLGNRRIGNTDGVSSVARCYGCGHVFFVYAVFLQHTSEQFRRERQEYSLTSRSPANVQSLKRWAKRC